MSIFIPSIKWEHTGGFELERVFGIKHTPSIWEYLYHFGFPFTRLFTYFNRPYFGKIFKVNDEDLLPPNKYSYFYGTWQSDRYLTNPLEIKGVFRFDKSNLSKRSAEIANSLSGITISVHIRRGDYQSNTFINGFGTCCPIDYYRKAIQLFKNKFPDVLFVFFSDDMDWVKKNLMVDNSIYVTHNKGIDNWQDMYLMSQCQHNIIANSSFSWWGAWLNNNENKIVIAPKRWWSTIENDDVVPKSWIRM